MLANSRRHQIGHSSIVEMSNIIPWNIVELQKFMLLCQSKFNILFY
jgi:hypothetical protein